MESVTHRLLIRHPSRAAVLVEASGSQPRLPVIVTDDRHTAEVDYINAAVAEQFDLTTTVLRSLRHELNPIVRTHELELHGGDPRPARWGWVGTEAVASLPPDDAAAVADWFQDTTHPSAVSRPWTQPGWFDEARRWIAQQVAAGGGTVREIVQLRSWASSCVLHVHATDGDRYLKAVPAGGPEWPLTEYLSRHFPNAVPRQRAADAERRWLLMDAVEGRCLEDLGDVAAWQRAAVMYGELQVGCLTRTDALRGLGCPLRSLEQLAAAIAPLAADDAALRIGDRDGLSPADAERFRALVPALRDRCSQLADQGMPLTLEHGDLWPGNFLLAESACVLIDWEDAAVGHPFFSLAPLLVGLAIYQPAVNTAAARRAIEDAYLVPFGDLGDPERLHIALATAAPLSFIDMALRYRNQAPSMVRLHPWMRDLVPQAIKRALDALP